MPPRLRSQGLLPVPPPSPSTSDIKIPRRSRRRNSGHRVDEMANSKGSSLHQVVGLDDNEDNDSHDNASIRRQIKQELQTLRPLPSLSNSSPKGAAFSPYSSSFAPSPTNSEASWQTISSESGPREGVLKDEGQQAQTGQDRHNDQQEVPASRLRKARWNVGIRLPRGLVAICLLILSVTSSYLFRESIGDFILYHFQYPIEKNCAWAEKRIQYLNQLDPSPLEERARCIPTLCPNTLSFLSYPNPYAVLGLPSPSQDPTYSPPTQRDIQRAYRTLALIYHPDKSRGKLATEVATTILAILTSAAQTLQDPRKKAKFDREWHSTYSRFTTATNNMQRRALEKELGDTDFWTVFADVKAGDLRRLKAGHWYRLDEKM